MNQLFDLTGKSAIVTGASTGLGMGMTLALASAGADVLLVDYVPSTEVAGRVQAMGRRGPTLLADLSKMESIDKVVATAIAEFGKIDILVNNAGIIRRTPAIDFSEKDWDDVMTLNAKTVFFLAQAAARDMMKRKYGKIINIASLLAFQAASSCRHIQPARARLLKSRKRWPTSGHSMASTSMLLHRDTWQRTTPSSCGRTRFVPRRSWSGSLLAAGASRRICRGRRSFLHLAHQTM